MSRRTGLRSIELWDGTYTWCSGYRYGLPYWRWGWAPAGLATKRQLHRQGRRCGRGQDPFGLLVWRKRGCGEQFAELYRLDQTSPAQRITPAVRAAVAAMEAARRTCSRCGHRYPYRMPSSTRLCWPCMRILEDYGAPANAA